MSRSKKRKLVAIGSLALVCLTALFSCLRGTGPGAGDERPTALAGHKFPVQALAFSPDGATLTSAACFLQDLQGMEVTVWDVRTGKRTTPRTESSGAILALAFGPGGRTLAAAVKDQAPVLWEVTPWRERRLEGHRSLCYAVAFADDGAHLAATDFDKDVTLWEVNGGKPKTCWKAPTERVVSLAFAPGGAVLASGGLDNIVRLWDVATGKERVVLTGHVRPAVALAFAPDGRTLAAGDGSGVVKLWDVAALRERATLTAADDKVFFEDVPAVTFAPDGGTLAVAIGPAVQLWDVATGHLVARLEGHAGNVRCLAYSPDGTLLASGGHDRTVRLWDVARYRPSVP
jgi:WD40 repeat protein